jgi:hypothetical protein
MKELFSFNITVNKEVEKTETKEENGQTITVTQKVKEDVPVRIIIKQPSRKNMEDADLQYSIELSNCVKRGVLTKGMLTKKYSDTGGSLSEEDANELTKLYSAVISWQNDLTRVNSKTEVDKESETVLIDKILAAKARIVQIESDNLTLFNNTADTIAQNNVIRWFCLHMAHIQASPSGNIEPMFTGSTTEEKLNQLYILDEKEDLVYRKSYNKLATFVSFWYYSKNAQKEDFEKLESDIESGKFN